MTRRLAELLDARPVRVPAPELCRAAGITGPLRLQATSPGWADQAMG
ncbi:MAG: hypothetical protein ACR2MN_00130 [Acidimicrobiales bacterium]